MYIPPYFVEDDPTILHDLIEQYSFGLLISSFEGRPFASHLPFLLDRKSGPNGALIGHMARANPQWECLDGQEILAVFAGPHAYISPSWYEAENVVPTWNYVAVHVYGRARLVHDIDALLPLLAETVRTFEQNMPTPWSLSDDDEFARKLSAGIVGFRIEIERLEGKKKLSQNHSAERRTKVIAALKDSEQADAREIARLMGE